MDIARNAREKGIDIIESGTNKSKNNGLGSLTF